MKSCRHQTGDQKISDCQFHQDQSPFYQTNDIEVPIKFPDKIQENSAEIVAESCFAISQYFSITQSLFHFIYMLACKPLSFSSLLDLVEKKYLQICDKVVNDSYLNRKKVLKVKKNKVRGDTLV
jgi:hypothetical protein